MAYSELMGIWGGENPPYKPVEENVNKEFAHWRWEMNYEDRLREDPNFASRIAGKGSVHFSGEDPHDPAVIWSNKEEMPEDNFGRF